MSDRPAHPPFRDTAKNLLFGLMALQNNFVSRDALVAAFGAWIGEKSKSLGEILHEQGHLKSDRHALLLGLVREHLKLHGDDPEQSLANLSPMGGVLRSLREFGDSELSASLAHVTVTHRTEEDLDFDATATFLGAPTSSGGRFHVLRLHAQGGLGEVYVARDEEIHRDVALKQIKSEYAGDTQSRARFLVEAEITGGLEHPGIVPVYGLGTYDDGRPFYAMRFIRGDSLKGAIARFHADQPTQKDAGLRTLALQKLLRRFLDVCNAISYAHSRGVLHRDLKPGNIMLGEFGETLVVDWGLAKLVGRDVEPALPAGAEPTLRPESGSQVEPTVMGARLGTPAFMPPEQAAGRLDQLGTSSDVYSLGATLYVLLTGRPPFIEPDLPELLLQVERGEFPRPRQLHPWIDQALEAICLKAMVRETPDRYASPRALAEDIEHWLADEPVTARRDSLLTRSWRWVRKHRTLSTSAAVVVLLSAAGLGIGLTRERQSAARIAAERVEAERRLDQVMTYEDYFTGFNEDVLRDRKLPPALLESLLAKPRKFYAQLTTELASRPKPTEKERALLARGRQSLGRILLTLGRHSESEQESQGAVRIYEALERDRPGVPDHQDGLSSSNINLGLVLSATGRHAEAEQAYGKAIAALERLVKDHPAVPDYQFNLVASQVDLGNLLRDTDRPTEALVAFGKGIAGLERLVKDHPGEPEYQYTLAGTNSNLGITAEKTGRHKEAAEAYGKAIAALERLVKDHPDVPDYQHVLAGSYINLGDVLTAAKQPREEQEAYEKAIAALERLVKEHPGVPSYAEFLANGYYNLGYLFGTTARLKEAEQSFRKAAAVRDGLVKEHPAVPEYQIVLAASHRGIAAMLEDTGRLTEAEPSYASAIAVLERLVKDHPGVAETQDDLATCYNNFGLMLLDLGRIGDAKQVLGKAIAVRQQLLAQDPKHMDNRSSLGGALNNLGKALFAEGDVAASIARYHDAIGFQRAAFERQPDVVQFRQFLSNHYIGLAKSLRAVGRADEAAGVTRDRSNLWPANPGELYNAACELALCVPIAAGAEAKKRYADEAMAGLHAAVAAGWSDAAPIALDPDLAPLRERPDFQAVLVDLFDRAFPADPFARPHVR